MSGGVRFDRCWLGVLAPHLRRPTTDATLSLTEWCVLWLTHADPRLSMSGHGRRLRALLAVVDPSVSDTRAVSQALKRLSHLTVAAAVMTRGFLPAQAPPTPAECEVAFMATERAFGRHRASPQELAARREVFHRVMGSAGMSMAGVGAVPLADGRFSFGSTS